MGLMASVGTSFSAASLTVGEVITLLGIVVVAVVTIAGYLLTQAWARRERWARSFAEALAAVEDYLELPYRVRRRPAQDDGTTRFAITSQISDVQTRLKFHSAWLRLQNPAVALAYGALVRTAREEAAPQRHEAWRLPPIFEDSEVPMLTGYPHPRTDAARAACIEVMRDELRVRIRMRRRGRTR